MTAEKKHYYKGLDENLRARNDFQYEIGKEHTAQTDDSWHWLHFAKKVTDAILYGNRIVEVEPVTPVQRFGTYADMNAKTIRIIRELPRAEILEKLIAEKCEIYKMVHLEPTYEELLQYKDHIRRCDHNSICYEFEWLTEEQKLSLLPKSWRRCVHVHEFSKNRAERLR